MFGKTSLDSEKDNVGTSVCEEELVGGGSSEPNEPPLDPPLLSNF